MHTVLAEKSEQCVTNTMKPLSDQKEAASFTWTPYFADHFGNSQTLVALIEHKSMRVLGEADGRGLIDSSAEHQWVLIAGLPE